MTIRTQTRYPSTVVSDDAVGTVAWADPEKAETQDNDPATATGPGITEWLKCTGYPFNLPSDAVPQTALILPRRKGGGQGTAWTVIGSQRLESAQASVSFPGISTTYRMFRVTLYAVKDGTTGSLLLRVNNDSGSNYSRQRMIGNDTAVASARNTTTSFFISGINTVAANGSFFASITVAKQIAASPAMLLGQMAYLSSAPGEQIQALGGQWNNTSDLISRIDLISSSGNFAAGTVAVLEAV